LGQNQVPIEIIQIDSAAQRQLSGAGFVEIARAGELAGESYVVASGVDVDCFTAVRARVQRGYVGGASVN
jgi:hypothetical protein